MNKYTIYCTEEQTKKALELGAPIVHHENAYTSESIPHCYIGEYGNYQKGFILYIIPTAEQMIGWLEEQGIMFNIATNPFDEFKVIMTKASGYEKIANIKWNISRKEATLAAIDAALEYLTNIKK